ncbi:hypothetical protein GH808_05375 [Acetobacterium fimetarium]|uniref:Ig-like domain-containing protein n=1 Tax=Acetobacterium fimetarium TaxID=52691 RepID=A0ABR6WUH1_9FIRM|nr:Ig-like domain-containing protein [Acetobacterium fimetarium]MBC3803866.1 hypothetical protein [Acetobacterium fimetarium]
MKQKPIISIIIILLVLLTAIIFFRDNGQNGNDMKTYRAAGTYSETATYQNALITVSGVTIENATFTGNVTVADSVTDGETHLTSCNVAGELFVYGGDTIYISSGAYQKITVEKPGTKVILLGDAKVTTLDAKSVCTVVAGEKSQITNLIAEKTDGRIAVTSQDNGTITNIQANGIADITLSTAIRNVTFGPDAAGSTLVANAAVEKIQAGSKVALTLNANVGSLIITGAGEGTTVKLGNNAVVASLGADARVEITGEGSITSATTNNAANITGTITPGTLAVTTTPLVNDPSGGLMVSKSTSQAATTGGSSSSGTTSFSATYATGDTRADTLWYSESSTSGNLINPKYEVPVTEPSDEPAFVSVTGIQVLPIEADVLMGNTLILSADIRPENATNKAVVWESANPGIATVYNGVVTPVSNGQVMIVARTADGDKTAFCKVTVKTSITAVTMIDSIDAVNHSVSETIDYNADYTLPICVTVQGYGSSDVFSCSVNWAPESADNKKVGESTYVGTLTMPDGYVNYDGIQPTIKLTVRSQPVITVTSGLSSQRIYLNGNPAPISVDATVSQGKTLSYQWFKRINTVDTTIDGATESTYDPGVSKTSGTVYYYCTITADNAETVTKLAGIVVTGSDPASPTALSELPQITSEPESTSLITAGSPVSLTVEASVDDGTLTYQWFTSPEAVAADGTAIAGATDKTLNVTAPDPSGSTCYYVEITNAEYGCSPTTAVSRPYLLK